MFFVVSGDMISGYSQVSLLKSVLEYYINIGVDSLEFSVLSLGLEVAHIVSNTPYISPLF